jgi:hypothetical protein
MGDQDATKLPQPICLEEDADTFVGDWNEEFDIFTTWGDHTPAEVRALWPTFNRDQRLALMAWGHSLACTEFGKFSRDERMPRREA